MDKLLFQMPCLSESRRINSIEIYERLFDKKVDKRYLESAVQKFLLLNKKNMDFLGVTVEVSGAGRDLSMRFLSSNYIGAVPIKMPYDGIAHKDFQVKPRFENDENSYSKLTDLLGLLDYSIIPEYTDSEPLVFPLRLRPPLYYEAVKYIELFKKAYEYNWVQFKVISKIHSYPKSGTNWNHYALRSSDPYMQLKYEANDSVFSVDHIDWQALKYVFMLSKNIIMSPSVPTRIRYKYREIIQQILNKTIDISDVKTDHFAVHSNDPVCIKNAKKQANIILARNSTVCMAWRMDIAELFERYVQHIVSVAVKNYSGTVKANEKIRGRGNIPYWGLKYLEPDIIIKLDDNIVMADAKYKAHYYSSGRDSEKLKHTHREDLHQLLAYCSFEPQLKKTGILFYPSRGAGYKVLNYTEKYSETNNKVILVGLPFGIDSISNALAKVNVLLQKEVLFPTG